MTVGFALSPKGKNALEDHERDSWISLDEASSTTGIAVATIAHHIDTDQISWRHGINNAILVDREDIELRLVNGAMRQHPDDIAEAVTALSSFVLA